MMQMSKIWVSIDGGGTKTCICACEESKNILYSERFGTANYKSASIKTAEENLCFGIGKMMKKLNISPQNIEGAVVGLSGCDTREDREIYTKIISQTGIPVSKTYLCNDTELIFRGMTDEEGLCVIAGTGSIVCVYDKQGLKSRAGGWGAPLSDEGSGYWIGAQIVKKMIRVLDGLEECETEVFYKIRKNYLKGCTNEQWKLSKLSVAEIASIALAVFAAAEKGDKVCKEILEISAEKITELILAACKKADLKNTVNIVAAGSLFSDFAYRENVFKKVSCVLSDRNICFLIPKLSPAAEGLRFAMNRFV